MSCEFRCRCCRGPDAHGGIVRALPVAIGLIGAAILASAVLPLSTAYSLSEFTGQEGALDDGFRGAPFFYGSYLGVAGLALVTVLLPGMPLIGVLVLSQVLNAILLLPLLVFMYLLARDPQVMGGYSVRGGSAALYVVISGLIASCLTALAILTAGCRGRSIRQEAQVGGREARVLYDGDRAGGPVKYGARDLADPAFSTPDRCRDWRQHAVGLRSMQRRRCRERTGKQQDVDVEPMSPTSATNRSTTRE